MLPHFKSPHPTASKESLMHYFLSDLGLDLEQNITIPRVFLRTASTHAAKTALLEKVDGTYRALTFGQLKKISQSFAGALMKYHLPFHGCAAILMKNSPAWVIADLGIQMTGGIVVPIYETLSPHVVRHILNNSESQILILEDASQLAKIQQIEKELPALRLIVVRHPAGVHLSAKITSLDLFLEEGKDWFSKNEAVWEERFDELKRDDLASLVYTSGTTGDPKGVMLSHRNLLSNIYGVLSVTSVDQHDTALSILPLSHTFERTVGYYLPLLSGTSIGYAEGLDKLDKNFMEVRPTICCAVPRVFEKLHEKMMRKISEGNFLARAIFNWALRVGQKVWIERDAAFTKMTNDQRVRHRPEDSIGTKDPFGFFSHPFLFLQYLAAHFLVYGKIRKKLGGRIRFFVAGGAPMNQVVGEFFRNLQLIIYEGYGLTETSPIISFNYLAKSKTGTVGKLLPYVQVRIAADGEILVKGPNVMAGYYKNPAATAEVLNPQGWLHTGDIGKWDEKNYLKITDRKKELLVLSTGKNVPPLPIENTLNLSPLISNSVVLGNNQKYVSALVFPNLSALKKLAADFKIGDTSLDILCAHDKIRETYGAVIEEANKNFSHYEQVKKFELVPVDLANEPDVLTPTLKIKRRVVNERFKSYIERLYRGGE